MVLRALSLRELDLSRQSRLSYLDTTYVLPDARVLCAPAAAGASRYHSGDALSAEMSQQWKQVTPLPELGAALMLFTLRCDSRRDMRILMGDAA